MNTLKNISRTGQVVLARLLVPAKAGLTAAKVAADLSKLDAGRFSEEKVAAELEGFRAHDQVVVVAPPTQRANKPPARGRVPKKQPARPKPPAYELTVVGRDAALQSIGLQKAPAKPTWSTIVEHLTRVAVAATPQTPPLKTKPALAAYMIRRQFDLDVPEGAKLPSVIAAIVCKTVGFPGISDYKSLEARVLGSIIEAGVGLTPKTASEQFVRSRLSSKRGKVDEIKRFAVQQWLKEGRSTFKNEAVAPQGAPVATGTGAATAGDGGDGSLARFARRAVDAAHRSETGWFGDNKVFISHAWRSFREHSNGEAAANLAQFKDQLIRANTAGLLELSRADLVALMDPTDVRESEARYLNTSFHFILLERGRS